MATLSSVWRDIKSKHFRISESAGSIGLIGIVLFLLACLLIWKKFLGKFSIFVALAVFFAIPLFGL